MKNKDKSRCFKCDGAICPHYAQCIKNEISERAKDRINTITDKEVIIDGIDVTGCCCFENGKCLWQKKYYENGITPDCNNVKDYYFKQLARKTKECEELKQKNKSISDIADGLQKRNYNLQRELKKYKEKVMELRKGYDEEDCTTTCPNMQSYENEIKKYKQALEEIKEIIKETREMLTINPQENKTAVELDARVNVFQWQMITKIMYKIYEVLKDE